MNKKLLYVYVEMTEVFSCERSIYEKRYVPNIIPVVSWLLQFGYQWMAERLLYIIYFEKDIHW